MSKTNVVVLNSAEQTSMLTFDTVSSLVNFVGHFLDLHNKWNLSCALVLVHQNNQVVRQRFERLGDLVTFTQGIQVAGWLMTDEGGTPNLNCLEWADDNSVAKVFDSRDDDARFDDGDAELNVPIVNFDSEDDDPEPTPDEDAEPNEHGEFPA